jgi:hypothetical protein
MHWSGWDCQLHFLDVLAGLADLADLLQFCGWLGGPVGGLDLLWAGLVSSLGSHWLGGLGRLVGGLHLLWAGLAPRLGSHWLGGLWVGSCWLGWVRAGRRAGRVIIHFSYRAACCSSGVGWAG